MIKCQTQIGHGKNDYCEKDSTHLIQDKRGRYYAICDECISHCDAEQRTKVRPMAKQLTAEGHPKNTGRGITIDWDSVTGVTVKHD